MSINTPTTSEDILNQAYNNGKRGNALLEVALGLPDLPAESLIYILASEFPERDARDQDPLSWISVVERFGASRTNIMDLVSQVLSFNDYPNVNDGATEKCTACIPFARLHMEHLTAETLVAAVERIAINDAGSFLKHFSDIKEMLEKYERAELVDTLLRRACGEVQVISTMKQVEGILQMPLDVRKRVVNRMLRGYRSPTAVVPPVRNLATVYLAIHVLISGGWDDELAHKLVDSLTWKQEGGKFDGERAIRLFRWYLMYLENVPVKHEPWMGRFVTAEEARQTATRTLIDWCRKALAEKGIRFERATIGKNPNTGKDQIEVRFESRGITKVYVAERHAERDELAIRDGEEVIVPESVPGDTLFRRSNMAGWRYEIHPCRKPSPKMQGEAWKHGGNF